jgi:hypothetical protein
MRESTVEAHLRKKATAAGALVRKMFWPGHRGAPDRLVVWSPVALGFMSSRADGGPQIDFVELKAPGKKPDPHQEREHARLRGAGCTVLVLDTVEAVDDYVTGRTQ